MISAITLAEYFKTPAEWYLSQPWGGLGRGQEEFLEEGTAQGQYSGMRYTSWRM